MSVGSSFKLSFFSTDIWSCNNTSYLPLILHCKLSCNLTTAIQFIKSKCVFISTYLQHWICRCIYNHMPCRNLFLSQFIKNGCSTCTLIANNNMSCSLRQLVYKLLRKSMLRKCLKRLSNMKSHHFPMPCHGILSITRLIQICIISKWIIYRRYLF